LKKRKIKENEKVQKKVDFFFKNLNFLKKYENDLTRRHFLAVGLAYADGKS
jgi:hypothetical protein